MSTLSGPVQIFDQGELVIGSTKLHPVGTLGVTKDGRKFRYSLAGASDLDPGKLCVTATPASNHENIAVAVAAAVGATQVSVTLGATAATANQYADGYLVVNDAAGEGIAYLITGHPAHAGSGTLVVTIAQPGVRVALTTSSEVSLIANPWSGAVISVTDQADMPIGVPNVTITAAQYGWIQTAGPCSALADETLSVGAALTTGTGVAGALEVLDAAGEVQVGIASQAGVDTEYRQVFLTID